VVLAMCGSFEGRSLKGFFDLASFLRPHRSLGFQGSQQPQLAGCRKAAAEAAQNAGAGSQTNASLTSRVVFIAEMAVSTNIVRLCGRGPHGGRFDEVPQGTWTITGRFSV
jgi:hypothetical protein